MSLKAEREREREIVLFCKIFSFDLVRKFGADMLHAKRVAARTELLIVRDYSARVFNFICVLRPMFLLAGSENCARNAVSLKLSCHLKPTPTVLTAGLQNAPLNRQTGLTDVTKSPQYPDLTPSYPFKNTEGFRVLKGI